MFDLERTVLLVSLRREVMVSAASWSVANPAGGGGEPIISRTPLQWLKMKKVKTTLSPVLKNSFLAMASLPEGPGSRETLLLPDTNV